MSDLIERLEQRAEELAGVDMALDAANSKDIALLHEAAAALRAQQPQPIATAPRNPNSGHGHVWPRPDGVRMRCGGPGVCPECSRDLAKAWRDGTLPTRPQAGDLT